MKRLDEIAESLVAVRDIFGPDVVVCLEEVEDDGISYLRATIKTKAGLRESRDLYDRFLSECWVHLSRKITSRWVWTVRHGSAWSSGMAKLVCPATAF